MAIRAYYNDNDKKICVWLKRLIRDGLITDGDVDDRSIADIRPDDVLGYDRVHFFAGVAGWDYAINLAGWGDAPVWTGSCPCQPFSIAGKQRGTSDKRHLWPEMFRLIRECHPPTCFGEQVAGSDGRRWLSSVFADLESVGYRAAGADLCAAGIGAPHVRSRLFWVAGSNSKSIGRDGGWGEAFSWRQNDFEGLVQQALQLSVPAGRRGCVSDGIPRKLAAAAIRGFGNSIVPRVAATFIEAYMSI